MVNINAERLCINGVECVLNVYECRHSAELLRFCDSVERNRCLTARLRTVYLNNSALRQTAYTERIVKTYRACRHAFNIQLFISLSAEEHYSTLTVVLDYLLHSGIKSLFLLLRSGRMIYGRCRLFCVCLCHIILPVLSVFGFIL